MRLIKKFTFCISICATSAFGGAMSDVLQHNNFDGLYIGAGIGGENLKVESVRRQENVDPAAFFLGSQTKSNIKQFEVNFSTGFSKTFNKMFYISSEINANIPTNTSNKYVPKYSYNLQIKPGIVLRENIALYGILGVGFNKIDFSAENYQCTSAQGCGNNTFVYEKEVDQSYLFYQFGGGVRVSILDNLTASLDFNYKKNDTYSYAGATYSPGQNARIWNVHNYTITGHSVESKLRVEYVFVNV